MDSCSTTLYFQIMEFIKNQCKQIRDIGFSMSGAVVAAGAQERNALLRQYNEKLKTLTDNVISEAKKMDATNFYLSNTLKTTNHELGNSQEKNKRFKKDLKDCDKMFTQMKKEMALQSQSTASQTSQDPQPSTSASQDPQPPTSQDDSQLGFSQDEISFLMDDSLDDIEPNNTQEEPDNTQEEPNNTEKQTALQDDQSEKEQKK